VEARNHIANRGKAMVAFAFVKAWRAAYPAQWIYRMQAPRFIVGNILGDEDINKSFFIRVLYPAAMLFLTGMPPLTFSAFSETSKVEGFIQARNGETMVLKTGDSHKLIVILNDSTQVGQVQGVLKARRKDMSMAALIPGLQVKVEGEYTNPDKMIATSVSFKGNDLERAQAMQAGIPESKMQLEKHQAD